MLWVRAQTKIAQQFLLRSYYYSCHTFVPRVDCVLIITGSELGSCCPQLVSLVIVLLLLLLLLLSLPLLLLLLLLLCSWFGHYVVAVVSIPRPHFY